jgi:CDP-glucose 4,6-dehydratase
MPFGGIYRGKRVLVTGHTGFKGAWLSEWLLTLGADVTGLSLPAPSSPALFEQLDLAGRMNHRLGDIRDLSAVRAAVAAVRPDFVFHLAAQSLVRRSYQEPVETYATNVLGTVHVLEALRKAGRPCSVVAVTSDKCYENREWIHSYRESDPLGGHDPYSSSKGAAELAIDSYRRSYFSSGDARVRLASARAGNVIGGGDWAQDRIVPDCIRALQQNQPIPIRNPHATRPWQHVLEPLSGYLWLAASLSLSDSRAGPAPGPFETAFNFGPASTANRTVAALVQEILQHWPGGWEDRSDPRALHEAGLLHLATDKALHHLKWQSVWGFEETIARTVGWYRACDANPAEALPLTRRQIADYTAAARARTLPWAA